MRIELDGMLLKDEFAGVEFSIFSLARALAAFGSEQYELVVPREFPASHPEAPNFETFRAAAPAKIKTIRILWEQMVFPIRIRKRRAALVHAPGYIAPLLADVPVVISVYDVIALKQPELCTVSNRLHYRVFMPLSVQKASGIIVPSEKTKQDLGELFPKVEGKTTVIPLGVATKYQVLERTDSFHKIRQKYALPQDFILFVGQREPKKNLQALIHAFEIMARDSSFNHGLVVAGKKGWGQSRVHRIVRDLGLSGRVTFADFVAPEDLPYLYNMADAFVFPSLYEGFGLPPLEAMACGIPVVCSNRGSLPEVVGDAALLADATDPSSIAASLHRAINEEKTRTDLIEKGKQRARQFTWRKTAELTEAFYREIMSRQG
ncbi:MAG: glycosyltransferase family 1 protein [Kiritimatiellia bacterium]|jgi:glycosyltransferase involved in cell wall biosynthesis|nr:glycosyltransferase family 1 protein [Kiritimatiellia bacterium]